MGDETEVELWSTEPDAVEATRATLRMMPGSPVLTERDGRWYVPKGFVAWACERQGYVKRAIIKPLDAQEKP